MMVEWLILVHLTLQVADRWEKYHLTPQQTDWFQSLRGGFGHCCDIADGFPADDWERRLDSDGTSHVWAKFDGKWFKVPDGNVLHDHNLVGVPVIWLTTDKANVRCFLPGIEN